MRHGGWQMGPERRNDDPIYKDEEREMQRITINPGAGVPHIEDSYADIAQIRKRQRADLRSYIAATKGATVQTASDCLILPESVIRVRLTEMGVELPDAGISEEDSIRVKSIIRILLGKPGYAMIMEEMAKAINVTRSDMKSAIMSTANPGIVLTESRHDGQLDRTYQKRKLMFVYIPEDNVCRAKKLFSPQPVPGEVKPRPSLLRSRKRSADDSIRVPSNMTLVKRPRRPLRTAT